MTEPVFEVYDKTREDVPDEPFDADPEDFNPAEVPADDTIEGWDALTDFLDNNKMTVTVGGEDDGEEASEIEVHQYCWVEVGVESAPIHEFCSECDASVQTSSAERLADIRNMHHVSTGH